MASGRVGGPQERILSPLLCLDLSNQTVQTGTGASGAFLCWDLPAECWEAPGWGAGHSYMEELKLQLVLGPWSELLLATGFRDLIGT